jgi:signal transduction histidine kinase
MTTTEHQPPARPVLFQDGLVPPFMTVVMIVGTIVQLPYAPILYPPVALPLFALTALAAVGTLFPWTRLSDRGQVTAMAAYMVLGALLLPLAHSTTTAALFPYIAASTAGMKLRSRRAATGIAVAGAVLAAGAVLLVSRLSPDASQWTWWLALTVGLPVYIGVSNRDRVAALHSAQRAAEEAQRATASEAREAALLERGRIAREIHDLLGHSLSGIALQLDLADALRESGREEEATAAIHRARGIAVDSIGETRRAVHALREDTRPLPDTLRRLAERDAAGFTVTGEVRAIDAEATHTVVRAAQEALTNAAKHAPGASCTMDLAFTTDRLTLTVHNEAAPAGTAGTGPGGGSGFGLIGMRERVTLLGGTVRAQPAPEGGWTVELELPR